MMTTPLTTIVNALKPNQRFWLLQLATVPLMAILGAFYVLSSHAGDFSDSGNSDYVMQTPPAGYNTVSPAEEHPMAHVQSASPVYKVHFSRYEFPTQLIGGSPSDPVKLTMFQQQLFQSIQRYNSIEMTNHLEHADYRVEIECGGVLLCSKLQLNIFDAHRNFLSSLYIPRAHLVVNEENLQDEAQNIAAAVNKRILAFPYGGFGTYDAANGAL